MSLPFPIPTESPYPSSVGFGTGFTQGWAVWAHQRMINRFHAAYTNIASQAVIPNLVDEDFIWGDEERDAIKRIQRILQLVEDGVSGMATQRRVGKFFTGDLPVDPKWFVEPCQIYRERYSKVPSRLLDSISYGEAVYWLGCASWNSSTNIDLGPYQDNLQDEELRDVERVMQAFDVRFQAQKKADELASWWAENHGRPGCSPHNVDPKLWPERVWRRAAMSHNRPLDGAVLARFPLDQLDSPESVAFEREWVGISGYTPSPWNKPLSWVQDRRCSFPGGDRVETRLDWCRFYALGRGKVGMVGFWPGLVCRYVTKWG